jgi:hypothetical protein
MESPMSDTSYTTVPPAEQPADLGSTPGIYQPNQRAPGVPPEGRRGKFWPDGDQEFKFEGDIQSAPEWVDKGWASYDGGPALAVPVGDPTKQPYTTITARKGDTIKYVARKNGMFGQYIVVKAEPIEGEDDENVTKYPAQQSQASLEDMLTTGAMTPADLSPDAKAQVQVRNPQMGMTVLGDEASTASAASQPAA